MQHSVIVPLSMIHCEEEKLEEERLAMWDRNLQKVFNDAWLRGVFDAWKADVFPPALELAFPPIAGVA